MTFYHLILSQSLELIYFLRNLKDKMLKYEKVKMEEEARKSFKTIVNLCIKGLSFGDNKSDLMSMITDANILNFMTDLDILNENTNIVIMRNGVVFTC